MIDDNTGASEQNISTGSSNHIFSNEALSDADQRLHVALNTALLGYFEIDLKTGLINCTSQCKVSYGLKSDDKFTRSEFFSAIFPKYHDDVENQVNDSLINHTDFNTTYEIKWPNSSIHWIKASGFARYDENNEPIILIGVILDITESKVAESKQATLAAIVDTSDDTIISKTLQGVITSWNKAAERMFGYTEEEAVGKHITMLIPPDRLAEEDLILSNVSQGNKVDHFETIRLKKDGTQVPISLTVSPIKDKAGNIIGASKIARNISMQQLAQEKQSMLAAIVDTSDDTIVSKTLQGIITSWNKAAERMFGYTEAEALGKHISMIIPPSRLHEEDRIIGSISQGKRIDHFETYRLTKDGREIPISLSVSPITDSKGVVVGASKIARDISEQRLSQEKQSILAAIVDTSDDTILSKTLEGMITSWNKAAERMFGYTEAEAVGKHISLIIPKSRLNEEQQIINNISKGKRVDHFETFRVTKDGLEIPLSISVSPIKDSKGNIIGASKIARDISEQIRAQEELKRYSERLELINSVGKAISENLNVENILQKVTDVTTKLSRANFGAFFYNTINADGEAFMLYTLSRAPKEAFDKFGMPRNTVVFHATFSGEGIVRVDDIRKDSRYGQSAPHYGMPQGHLPVVSYLAVPVISNDGKVIGGLFFGHREKGQFTKEHEDLVSGIASQAAIALDNAKLYEEIKAINSKKDEFIGLASHELKTPLTSITGYLQLLERNQTTEINKTFVQKAVQQVNKLTNLVSDLLDISKIEAGKLQLNQQTFDIKALVKETIELVQHTSRQHHISFDSHEENILIKADKQRIEQVIINLLTNAMKYSPKAKEVIVSLTDQDNQIQVTVQDFGIGIDKTKTDHIFSRFYRVEDLSPHMSGLGIGLYISKEIIERHKGKIRVASEPGKGSTFTFTLPKN